MKFQKIFLFGAMIAMTAAAQDANAADPIEIKFGFPAPPVSKVYVWGVGPWAEAVEKDAQGTIKFKFFYGNTLGTVQNMYDRTIKGIAQASFGVLGPLAGQFKQVYVTTLPFEAKNDLEASTALWRIYKKGLIAKEFGNVRPLALFTFPHAGFHTNKPVLTEADLRGLKIATSDRVMGQFITRLGASPVTMGPPDYYQAVSRGVADGIAVGWSAVTTFKLQEVTNYHLDVNSGLAGAYIFMNNETYAKLPEVARKAIDKHSGEPFSITMGEVTDRMDKVGRELVEKMEGQTVKDANPAVVERWKTIARPITEEWVKNTPDGANVLAAFRAEIQNIRGGK